MTLHTLDYSFSEGQNLDDWEAVLDVLKSGDMPPEKSKQPPTKARSLVISWIDKAMRKSVKTESPASTEPITRRLTNFEYQNTMRDLLGFELQLTRTCEDPLSLIV